MNDDIRLGYKIRQVLSQGAEALEPRLTNQLHAARQSALAAQPQHVVLPIRVLAGFGIDASRNLTGQIRSLLLAMALSSGVVGTYYWNTFEQTLEYEAVDSELLADELPPSIYLDQGFEEWLGLDSNDSP
jgi:hypothetical protein